MKCECGDCGWTGEMEALRTHVGDCDVERLEERIDPGSEVPAGECPECGCLAYLNEAENPYARKTATSQALLDACKAFIDTVESTGGVIALSNGERVPAADEDWPDLADAYDKIKAAMAGIEPETPKANYYVLYTHRHGINVYHIYSKERPSEEQVIEACDISFEPDREESIEIERIGEIDAVIPDSAAKPS